MENYEQDELNRRDHCRALYREHIGSSAVYAKEVLRGCFILNGAAVTAILASNKFDTLKLAVFTFALGALFSLSSGVFAYFFQGNVAKSWKFHMVKENFVYSEFHRNIAIGLGILSIFTFSLGLIIAACQTLN